MLTIRLSDPETLLRNRRPFSSLKIPLRQHRICSDRWTGCGIRVSLASRRMGETGRNRKCVTEGGPIATRIINGPTLTRRRQVMNFKKVSRMIVVGLLSCLVLCVCALGVVRWRIQSTLDEWCEIAQATHPHPGDDVAALLEYVQSESHSLRQRNLAVWALGQARDSRALSILEGCYTGEKCDHDNHLCQRELGHATKLCKGGAPNVLLIKTP